MAKSKKTIVVTDDKTSSIDMLKSKKTKKITVEQVDTSVSVDGLARRSSSSSTPLKKAAPKKKPTPKTIKIVEPKTRITIQKPPLPEPETENQETSSDDNKIADELIRTFIEEEYDQDEEEVPKATEQTESKKPEKPTNQNLSRKQKLLFGALLLLEAITGAAFISVLFRIGILQIWQNIILVIVVLGLLIFTAYKLLKPTTKKGTRIACGVLAVLMIVVYGVGYINLSRIVRFVENVTTVITEKQNYSVGVLKDSTYQDIEEVKDRRIGFLKNNIHLEDTKNKLREKISYEEREYDDLANMFAEFQSKDIAAITIATSSLNIMKDDAKEYYEQVRVIYTFDIEIEKEETTSDVDVTEDPFILYLSGIDSREGLTDTALSDVNMLIVIRPKDGKMLLVSVPRDYYVQLHGTTGNKDKLTHAGIYGIDMSKNTMADIFDVKIDYTAKVSFDTVRKLVSAIDGIDIYSDADFIAWTDHSCHIRKGNIHLDGKCALAFARERYAYETGDRHRVENQQAVFEAILKKATQAKYVVNYSKLLSAIEKTFWTSLKYDQITGFAKMQLNTLRSWKIESISVNGTSSMEPTYSMGSQKLYVMVPDQTTVDAAKEKIEEYLKKE